MSPKFPKTVLIQRVSGFTEHGDVLLTSGESVRAAIWDRKQKAVIGGQGEVFQVTAQGWFPRDTDVRLRDRVTLHSRVLEVVWVTSGYDDRDHMDHVGAEFREADGV